MKLTVKELLEEIKNMNLDDKIYIEMYSGCCGDTEQMEVSDIESYELDNGENILKICLNNLPGYFSCIQANKTKKDHNKRFGITNEKK